MVIFASLLLLTFTGCQDPKTDQPDPPIEGDVDGDINGQTDPDEEEIEIDPDDIVELNSSFFAMDTYMTLRVYGVEADSVMTDSEALVHKVEADISKTIEGSDIYNLNSSNGEIIEVSQDTADLLQDAIDYSEKTGGTFDISVAPLVTLWDVGGGRTVPPSQSEIDELLGSVGYERIQIDGTLVDMGGTNVDLGAIGKGHMSDLLDDFIREHDNVTGALFSLGGNVGIVGTKPGDLPFVVGIRDPNGEMYDFLGHLSLTDTFVVSSGDYERFFEHEGVRYHHIIDPQTGYPSESDITEISIICTDGAYADALSTALFIMGSEATMQYYNEHKDFEAVIVTKDGKITVTDGLVGKFTFTGAEKGYTYEQ